MSVINFVVVHILLKINIKKSKTLKEITTHIMAKILITGDTKC